MVGLLEYKIQEYENSLKFRFAFDESCPTHCCYSTGYDVRLGVRMKMEKNDEQKSFLGHTSLMLRASRAKNSLFENFSFAFTKCNFQGCAFAVNGKQLSKRNTCHSCEYYSFLHIDKLGFGCHHRANLAPCYGVECGGYVSVTCIIY